MTPMLLMQFDGLSETQRAVKDYFQGGGSLALVALVLVGIGGVVVLTYVLSARQRRARDDDERADPWKLFHDLTGKLELSAEQRRFLDLAATKSGLKHPAVMLLSPVLFDRCVGEARRENHGDVRKYRPTRDERVVATTRSTLFPGA